MQIVCRNRKRKQRRLNDKMTRRKNVQHIYELLLKTQQAKIVVDNLMRFAFFANSYHFQYA